jgi:CRISPR/Cas system CMR-associated protein Cmr5 small subunit
VKKKGNQNKNKLKFSQIIEKLPSIIGQNKTSRVSGNIFF